MYNLCNYTPHDILCVLFLTFTWSAVAIGLMSIAEGSLDADIEKSNNK